MVEADRVHGRLYTDARVFDDEMERIFHRGWVFVGHESEIAEPGDFVTRLLGRQPVLLTRSTRGEVRLFANRCPHRGAEVCVRPNGQARFFRCPYHAWTFDTDGVLVALPHEEGYPDGFDRRDHGLSRVPRTDSYRGFVFGSWEPEGPTLSEHLGNGQQMIDRLCDLSPRGEVEINGGWLRHRVDTNWKIIAENVCDFYHPPHTHASSSLPADAFRDGTGSLSRYLGNGHGEIDFRPSMVERPVRPLDQFHGSTRDYLELLAERDGPDGAVRRRREGAPHGLVFPNLFIAGQNLFVIQPTAADQTSHTQTPVFFAGVPDAMNTRQLRRFEGASGPAGMLEPDDSAVWERLQRGLAASQPEWVILQRGIDCETPENGTVAGRMLDETAQRGFWRHYLSLMKPAERAR
ncbi:MAG: aromatic ring-hydroxylating oxygenase subunit alpha [Acidimicrobiales bacterium]